jgi:hypothetical protein
MDLHFPGQLPGNVLDSCFFMNGAAVAVSATAENDKSVLKVPSCPVDVSLARIVTKSRVGHFFELASGTQSRSPRLVQSTKPPSSTLLCVCRTCRRFCRVSRPVIRLVRCLTQFCRFRLTFFSRNNALPAPTGVTFDGVCLFNIGWTSNVKADAAWLTRATYTAGLNSNLGNRCSRFLPFLNSFLVRGQILI